MLEYFMEFNDLEPFRIRIDNTGEIVENIRDYTFAALDILNAEDYDEG